MTLEIANTIRHGRAVGTEYVVTRRDAGHSGIVARFDSRDEAIAYMDRRNTNTHTTRKDRTSC